MQNVDNISVFRQNDYLNITISYFYGKFKLIFIQIRIKVKVFFNNFWRKSFVHCWYGQENIFVCWNEWKGVT